MQRFLNIGAIAGAVYLILGLFCVFILIPVGIDEPSNVEFQALAPAYWPRITCLILAGLGAAMLVRAWFGGGRGDEGEDEPAEEEGEERLYWRVALVIAGTFLLYFVLESLGFVLTGFCALVLLMLLAGERRPIMIGAVSLAVPFLLYFFFTKLAGIPIPAGILEPILV